MSQSRLWVLAENKAIQFADCGAMRRNEGIATLKQGASAGNVVVNPNRPFFAKNRARSQDALGSVVNGSVCVDVLNRRVVSCLWDFGETAADVEALAGCILDMLATLAVPTLDPKATKPTFSVENHDGFCRRGFDVKVIAHGYKLSGFTYICESFRKRGSGQYC